MNDKMDFADLKASGNLPSPKGVMLAVMRLCQREQVSLQELAHAIQADPVLAGRIIKVANVANPNKHRPIASVTADVLMLVGVQAIRQIVLGLSLVSSYRAGICPGFDYDRFWVRSLATACAAQVLAVRIRSAPPAEMFTCGLLAGIGRLALATAWPQPYADMLRKTAGLPIGDVVLVEEQRFGFSHPSLAAAMMADWNIPRMFCDAVIFHELPADCPFAPDSRQLRLVHLLHLASCIAGLCIAPADERAAAFPDLIRAASALGLPAAELAEIAAGAFAEWVEWADVLQFRIPGESPVHDLLQALSIGTKNS